MTEIMQFLKNPYFLLGRPKIAITFFFKCYAGAPLASFSFSDLLPSSSSTSTMLRDEMAIFLTSHPPTTHPEKYEMTSEMKHATRTKE